jgi:hypothetical protein
VIRLAQSGHANPFDFGENIAAPGCRTQYTSRPRFARRMLANLQSASI